MFEAIRQRLDASSPGPWTVERDSDKKPFIVTGRSEGENRLFIKRDLDPAGENDVRFIALAREAVARLLHALETGDMSSITVEDLDDVDAAAARASPAPWTPFIEETQPIGGPSMIWVGGEEDGPDMYVWLGDEIAPSSDIEFIARAREDVPRLVAEVRRRKG